MSGLEYIFLTIIFILYLCLLFSICMTTFKKGHTALGIIGIFLPILWVVGALLPAKRGSRYEVEQDIRTQAMIDQMTR
jgi:hypothetical protein